MINTNEPFRLEQFRRPKAGRGDRLFPPPIPIGRFGRAVPACGPASLLFVQAQKGGRRALSCRAGLAQAEKFPLESHS